MNLLVAIVFGLTLFVFGLNLGASIVNRQDNHQRLEIFKTSPCDRKIPI